MPNRGYSRNSSRQQVKECLEGITCCELACKPAKGMVYVITHIRYMIHDTKGTCCPTTNTKASILTYCSVQKMYTLMDQR